MQLQNINIRQVNWILIGIYLIYCVSQLLFSNWSGMDAAGRGMGKGFLMIYFCYVIVLAGLNLINAEWVSILVLVLAVIPVAYLLL